MPCSSETRDITLLDRAIELARTHAAGGTCGPFGAVIARDGDILGEGWNRVVSERDPTAHAEIVAIRQACASAGTHVLSGCTLYASCEPCPMCLGAIYWARIARIVFASTRVDAARAGFDDQHIYEQLATAPEDRTVEMTRLNRPEAAAVFERWMHTPHSQRY